ncbi:MAG: tripartite tricarboxylate transporter substrate-binding protein [Xanthobacteraceae bacterium]|jgi:tripartite-type tricarboxylate transporter receptor subunit TctC
MKLSRRQLLHLAVGAATLSALPRIASAQAYPTRPVTLVVPYGAGGLTDTIGRILAQGMREPLGQPVIVENVIGASGTIGVGRVARASADGYTLVLGSWATHVLNGPMFTLQYDLEKDFEPIALASNEPLVIVARKSMPAANLREFIAWLKANPGKAMQGTTGAGGISSVVGLFFQKETGTRVQFVPYRGGLGPAVLDLVAGQIDFMIDLASNSVPHVRAGTIKAYAVMSKTRLTAAPDIPTVDEAGMAGFYAFNWQGVFLPKGASADIIAKLNTAVVAALADPTVRRRLAEIGQEIFPREQQTPEALGALQKAEIEKWWPIIKAAGIKSE